MPIQPPCPWLPVGKLLADADDVMKALGIGKSKLHQLVKERRLWPTYIDRSMRFHPSDVERFVEDLRREQQAA